MNGIKKYIVPLMSEINETPSNGYAVISTFAGGGGSCTGYKMAGYKVLWANEFVEEAQRTYAANHPDVILDTRDIRIVQPSDVLRSIDAKPGDIDILDGSPPCCAFSTSGRRERGWGTMRAYSDGKTQQIETLFYEFIRILNGVRPKCFVAENVSGLVKGAAIGYFKEFMTEMKNAGYDVDARMLNAKYLGVPQQRERVIFIGVREDIGIRPAFPKPCTTIFTIRDALCDVDIDEDERSMLIERMQKSDVNQYVRKMPKNPYKRVTGEDVRGHGYFSLQRWPWDVPVGTICQSHGANIAGADLHPSEDRQFTINELKRLMSVPDDYILTGTYAQKYERLGRMVPPVMMYHIAKTLQYEVLDKI